MARKPQEKKSQESEHHEPAVMVLGMGVHTLHVQLEDDGTPSNSPFTRGFGFEPEKQKEIK